MLHQDCQIRSKDHSKNPRLEVNAIIEKPPARVYKEKEEVQIHPNRSDPTTFIAADLESKKKAEMSAYLRQNHDEDRMQPSIRLDYQATNNKAEYEALIVGLQAARHVGATKVLIHSDYQLVAQQLSGTFKISSSRLKLYVEAFEKLKINF
ncbi:uncharacterized protein LOC122048140 [Zingiber officinale]|uniref:uncharacterized protein LOC122048140 n=1 Tax=Zingiber officinale TaxID=94328 RepID=UPI001C4BAB25|nr:uncharacterized protein LOC122048140 [Zingiber officinale]